MSRYLARDIQSVTGKSLRFIQDLTTLNPWIARPCQLKQALVQSEIVDVPVQDRWRLSYLCSLLSQRREMRKLALENEEKYLDDLISSLVQN